MFVNISIGRQRKVLKRARLALSEVIMIVLYWV